MLLLTGVIGLSFLSCKEEDDLVVFLTKDAENEIKMIMAFDDVEYITYEGMELSNNIMEGRILHDEGPLGAACVDISFNNQENSTVIDFGEGCDGSDKKFRKGKITITQTGKYFDPGTIITVSLENYEVNDLLLEGKLTITNISTEGTMTPSFSIKNENGRVIFPDQTFATREIDYIRVWDRSNNPDENKYYVSGFAMGSFNNGTSYTSEVQTNLNYKWECRESNMYFPVQGTVSLEIDEIDSYLINYGNGACDKVVSISSNEKAKEITF